MAVNNTETEKDNSSKSSRIPRSWTMMLDITSSEWDILAFSTAFKLLLFPAYRSTDFEVHRNWLAITYSLPISKWYHDTTSEWTLDYPPFFAYFEKALSIPASFIDPRIVEISNLNYSAWSVIAYQRATVMLTELVLAAVLLKFVRGAQDSNTQRLISASLFLHPGFLIVDHIHFQYNGFLFGILLLSVLQARHGNLLASGFFFAVLLNFKHIYMYLAPAYFVYLLRSFCMSPQGSVLPSRFLALANVVILVFIASLGPFLLMGQIPQLFSRLFPFTRGLNHAYWAPNAWAVLTATDRVLLQYVKRFGASFSVDASGVSSSSRGLIGDTSFAVLPNIKPIHTFLITMIFQMVFLVKLWRTPTYKSFLTALTLCGYTSFMFGWHVHEKAVLLVLVPLSLLASENHAYFRTFMIASTAGVASLFPLLFTPAEQIIEVIYSLLWASLVFGPLQRRLYEFPRSLPAVVIGSMETMYLWGFLILEIAVMGCPILAKFIAQDPEKWDFLPLMLTSLYCAVGLIWAYARLSFLYITSK
ncbi:glycosyltransferase family 57 protein [Multifurca ochricompacta]|uniref:Alpha-1,3-glucosyltransferase n=1 Tax=Multifurca ochricompacta TaxID=376703 RepID=A0AAD4MBJ1_9AGAM|nr:glycosyltransferase family 57 protein [Multifurca ochricompacta]